MATKTDKELQLEVLLEEYKLTNEKIEQFLRSQFTYLNTTFFLIGGFITVVFVSKSELVNRVDYLNYLPFFLLLMLGLIAYHYQRTMGLQGYKIYLERAINTVVGQDLIFYAGKIGFEKMVKKNPFGAINLILYIVTYVSISALAYSENGNRLFMWLHVGAVLIFAIIALMSIPGYAKKVEKISVEQFKKEAGTQLHRIN